MDKNLSWLILIFCVCIVTTWFGGKMMIKLHEYCRLRSHSIAIIDNFSVERLKKNRYILCVQYRFFVAGKEYVKKDLVTSKVYPNPWVVEYMIEKLNTKTAHTVWYNPSNVEMSTLQRSLPWREIISFVILICLVVYFFILKSYVNRRSVKTS